MLFIFDREENLVATLENGNKNACPYYEGKVKSVLNGEQTIVFRCPYDHEEAKKIKEHGYIARKNKFGQWQLFIITELIEVHGEYMELEVFGESANIELDHNIIESEFYDRKAPAIVLPGILSGTRWEAGTIEATQQHTMTVTNESILTALQTFKNIWNVELKFHIEVAGAKISRRLIDCYNYKGLWKGKRFEYKKDLVEITRTIDAKFLKTAVFPLGKELEDGTRETIESVVWTKGVDGAPVDKPLGQKWIVDSEATAIWGKPLSFGATTKQPLYGFYENTEALDPSELIWSAWNWLQENNYPKVTYSAKVLDFNRLMGMESESIELGDTTAIIDRELGIEVQARVIEFEENLDNPENDEIVLGNFMPLFTDITKRIEDVESTTQRLANNQPDLTQYLKKGDPLDPLWLDVAFSFANDSIKTGAGTVIMNEGDGILIVDNPDDPQQAIRLLAGKIALANSRDRVTNTFNWRNFGTGEGWLADLVETGFLRFDRSKGGTLELGGAIVGYNQDGTPIYQNGVLSVVDSNGDNRVTLTGDTGGFDELYVSKLRGNNIINRSETALNIYVNVVSGSDITGEGTETKPFLTVQKALDSIPKYNNYEATVFVRPTNAVFGESLLIEGFIGSGRVVLYLGSSNALEGNITVKGCNNEIMISTDPATPFSTDISTRAHVRYQNQGAGRGVVHVERCQYVHLNRLVLNGNALADYGTFVFHSNLRYRYMDSYNINDSNVYGGYGGNVVVEECKGLANKYGLTGVQGAIFSGLGTAPRGNTLQKNMVNGAVCNISWVHDAGTPQPIMGVKTTSIWTNNDSATRYIAVVTGKSNFTETGYTGQGQRASTSDYRLRGYWFFSNRDFSELTNRKVIKARLLIQRSGHTGENKLIYPRIGWSATANVNTFYEGQDLQSSAVGFLWGEQKWIDIPLDFIEKLRLGTAKSLVLDDGSSSTNYGRFEGPVQLEVIHDKL